MPLLSIRTNIALDAGRRETLMAEASSRVADLLDKPEVYVMVSLDDDRPMLFGGSAAPLAYVELKSIGLPRDEAPEISEALCVLLERHVGIPPERVYIEFSDAEPSLWGWNGDTF
jgi:phenylpyruvate tautomerase PptA (4-oxalocrotonate tautomerase family)